MRSGTNFRGWKVVPRSGGAKRSVVVIPEVPPAGPMEILALPGDRGEPIARGGASKEPGPEADVDAAFEQLYHQVASFSRGMRVRLGEPNAGDARIRAAENVHVARTMFGKWSLEILSALYGARSIGFEELRRTLQGITASVLSYRLKRMEAHGLVAREVQATRPVRVRYRLTSKGLTVAVLGEPVFLYLQFAEMRERREARALPRRLP
jgi:DNA-binding HxlR family transcriptional regulator